MADVTIQHIINPKMLTNCIASILKKDDFSSTYFEIESQVYYT